MELSNSSSQIFNEAVVGRFVVFNRRGAANSLKLFRRVSSTCTVTVPHPRIPIQYYAECCRQLDESIGLLLPPVAVSTAAQALRHAYRLIEVGLNSGVKSRPHTATMTPRRAVTRPSTLGTTDGAEPSIASTIRPH